MQSPMRRRTLLAGAVATLAGCAPTVQQQEAMFTPSAAAAASRSRESRRFETRDRTLMLRAIVGALQDLGFTIEETQATLGLVVGSKLSGALIRAQVSVNAPEAGSDIVVRATFQRIIARPGAALALGGTLSDPVLYREFFEKIAQSVFLTSHEI